MDRFPKFDMIVEVPVLLKMWYNNLSMFHKRDLNNYVGALIELINMVGWPELIDVLMGYWDNEKMVFRFETMEITPTIEEIRDGIDTVGTRLERRVRIQENILIPNKPTLEDIINWLGLRKDYAFCVEGSSVYFMDLYVRFRHASFYANYNQEFRVTFREWDGIRSLAFTIALLGHRYFQGCNLLLQWWIMNHLAKGHETQQLHTLNDNNSLKGLNDMLFWTDLENRKTRGRCAQIFSELREEDIQWMLDRFISKDVIVRGYRQLVLPLPGIRGIRLYAPIRVLRQFGRRQTTPPNAYYRIYVFHIEDDRVLEASEMLKEWKKALRMNKDTIAADRFNARYDETYKNWLKDNLQGISFPVPDITAVWRTKSLNFDRIKRESLRSDLEELNLWIGDKKSGMCLEDWEETKGRRSDEYLLMIQYRLQHLMA
ncbi:hypothetical protein KY289_013600 [Solanum tuberosum]|nr:hypothetical protein KY289_013600 [Solanum tuberosum]